MRQLRCVCDIWKCLDEQEPRDIHDVRNILEIVEVVGVRLPERVRAWLWVRARVFAFLIDRLIDSPIA